MNRPPAALTAQICQAINTGLLTLDEDERVVMWNQWLEQRSNLAESAISGRPFTEVFPDLANGRVHKAIQAALKQGMASTVSQSLNRTPFPLYIQINRLNQQAMQQAISIMPLLCGEVRYCLVQIQDVTAATNREQELHRIALELEGHSYQDGLTGIPNRRAFDRQLQLEFRRAMRECQPLTVGLADVDYFKAYNDHYGHVAGDECLKAVAATFSGNLHRPLDLAARYGGEEFVFLLPHTDPQGAESINWSLCRAVMAKQIPHLASAIAPFVTVSIGVVSLTPPRGSSPEMLLKLADQALYRAKQAGRNQVCITPEAEALQLLAMIAKKDQE